MAVGLEQTTAGEVRVETGTGVVTKTEHAAGKRNAHVVFKATHADLKQPVAAWADTFDSAVWPLVQEAERAGLILEYRIEVRRKDGVDPAKPIADLANTDKVRDLAAVARIGELNPADRIPAQPPYPPTARVGGDESPDGADGEPGWLTEAGRDATAQRHAERPSAAPQEAPTPAHRCAPCDYTAPDSRALLAHSRSADHRARLEEVRADTQAAVDVTTFAGEAAPRERTVPTPPRRGAKVVEGKPWELRNGDGSLNLDSYAYRAVVDFVEFAHYQVTRRLEDALAAGEPPPEFRLGQVEALAKTLLEAADRVQALTRLDGQSDRMDGSHYRARSAVRTALKVYPVPWGVDAETRKAWLDEVVAHAAALLRISYDLFAAHDGYQGA
jgi:hypothetical protein